MKNKGSNIILFLLVWFVAIKPAHSQFYSGSFQEFGKNRVQEVTFFWQFYDFERFRIFFYGSGQEHAEYAAKSIHKNLQELESFFETELDGKLDVLVFNRQSDFRQSNIGLTNDITSNVGGKNNILGNKMFLYFEGTHAEMDIQIRTSLCEVLVNKMVYQGNWREVVRGSAKIDLPSWFTEGLYSYKSADWEQDISGIVRDNILNEEYNNLGRISEDQSRYAGHALWNYIAQVYGKEVIPQIIYLVSISRSFESSFRFVLGKTTSALNADMVKHYKNEFSKKEEVQKLPAQEFIPLIKRKNKGEITQLAISPDGNKIAYSTNELGKYFIWIYDLGTNKYTKVLKRGYKIDRKEDKSFPLIDWHPNGKVLAFIEEREGAVFFNFYDTDSKKKTKLQVQKIDKITSFKYNHSGTQFVFSGVQNGKTDLFLYTILGNGYLKLTDDFYDEIHPSFIENSTKVIFSSNRKSDSLYSKVDKSPNNQSFDVFIYDLTNKFQRRLKRVTNTPEINEEYPFELKPREYTYLANKNGVRNRYIAIFDSTISAVDTVITYRYFSKTSALTNYKRNATLLDVNTSTKQIGMLVYNEGSYQIFKGNASADRMIANKLLPSDFKNQDEDFWKNKKESSVEIISVSPVISDNNKIKTKNYQFEKEEKEKLKEEVREDKSTEKKKDKNEMVFMNPTNAISTKTSVVSSRFELPTRKLYNINFTLDEVVSQLDNNFINNSYQVFNASQPSFNNPNVNVFNMVQMKDLMEDYRLIGGVNLSFNLRDNDYLLSFEDLSQRIDKKYMFTRQVYSDENGSYPTRTMIHEFKYRLKYPFSEVSSIGLTLNLRNDMTIVSSVNRASLESPDTYRNMGGAKLEYVFDNTFNRGINLYEGTRLKLFGEFYNELTESQTDIFVLGADIRNYQKIHRELTFASRIATSTSFGNRKLVYYMGGVDGGFNPQFNNDNIIPTDQGFAFQTIATPMRGFIQNTRFGNSFAVINTELRWPIFRYFSQYPVQSKFLSSFQIVSFADAGTAWTGPNPYSLENSFNKREVSQKPITVIIENQREPIIFGYGFGLRAEIFGYFVRYDWSWGIEDGVNQGRISYFSLSLDF